MCDTSDLLGLPKDPNSPATTCGVVFLSKKLLPYYPAYKAIWHLRKYEISYYIRPWPSIFVIRPSSLYKARGGQGGGNLFTNKSHALGKMVLVYTKINAYEGSQAQLSTITDHRP